jgi:hypothetical protein
MWDAARQKFYVTSTPGTPGVDTFALDDTIAPGSLREESRVQSNVLFNGANGWVWEPGNASGPDRPIPTMVSLGDPAPPGGVFDPQVPPPGTPKPVTLPAPIITPPGGSFTAAAFPGSATISANGAPGGSLSALVYCVTRSNGAYTSWAPYSNAVPLT